jgi:ABC-type phosphate/phosphonate transport system substrate-binding protein
MDSPPVSDFRVVAASEPIPNDVVAAGPKLPAKTAAAISEVFKHMAETPEGKKLMADAFRVEAWLPVGDKDFDTAMKILQPGSEPDKKVEPAPAPAKAP